MNTVDYIVIAVVALIVLGAIAYIIKEKKKGTVCIGCPHAGKCKKHHKCK